MSSRLHGTFSILSFFLIFQSLIGIAHAWDGVVVRVVDGDTLLVAPKEAKQPELLRISVRLYGIDAPELAQPGGQESQAALEQMAHQGTTVEIIPVEADRYDRAVGVVMLAGVSLNIEQIRHGQAWVYGKYCKAAFRSDWKRIEQQARTAKVGLWHDALPVSPWEWRKRHQNHSNISGQARSTTLRNGRRGINITDEKGNLRDWMEILQEVSESRLSCRNASLPVLKAPSLQSPKSNWISRNCSRADYP